MPRRDTRLFKRKGSPNWFGRLPRGDGTYAKKSLKTTEYRVARARLRAWAIEFAGTKTDRPSNPHSGLTLADALVECELWHRDRVSIRKKFIAQHGWQRSHSRPPGCSESTYEIFVRKARHLSRLMAELPLRSLASADVDEYIATRRAEGAVSNTIGKELIELRKALKLADQNGHELSGTVQQIVPRFDPEYRPKTNTLTAAEAESLVRVLPPHRQLWVILGLWVGARVSGIERLTWSHVDLEQRLITIPETKTASSFRTLPLPQRALAALEAVPPEERQGKVVQPWRNVRRDLKVACGRAGIAPAVTPNDLRRTFGSWLYNERGIDADKTGHMMGHTSGKMVRLVYGQISKETEREMMALLPE